VKFYVISRFEKLYQYFIHGTEIPTNCTTQGQTACLGVAVESLAVTSAMGIFLYDVLYTPPSWLWNKPFFRFPLRLL